MYDRPTLSYTPDLFGLNRRQVESLEAQEDSQCQQLSGSCTLATKFLIGNGACSAKHAPR